MITHRGGIAELYATLVILSITLSMSFVVYSALRTPRTGDQATFFNRTSMIGGSPELLYLQVESSKPTALVSMQIDNISTTSGFIGLLAGGYVNSRSPCGSALVSFLSVYAPVQAHVTIESDGATWIRGAWRASGTVPSGWSEVILENASSCSISIPGGTISPLSLTAANETTHFSLFLPMALGTHSVLLVFRGGFDKIAFSA